MGPAGIGSVKKDPNHLCLHPNKENEGADCMTGGDIDSNGSSLMSDTKCTLTTNTDG